MEEIVTQGLVGDEECRRAYCVSHFSAWPEPVAELMMWAEPLGCLTRESGQSVQRDVGWAVFFVAWALNLENQGQFREAVIELREFCAPLGGASGQRRLEIARRDYDVWKQRWPEVATAVDAYIAPWLTAVRRRRLGQ